MTFPPKDRIDAHFRLTKEQKAGLKKLRLETLEDLLRHMPQRYEHTGASADTATMAPGAKVTLLGVFKKLEAKKLWKSRRAATEGLFEDARGSVRVLWFNQPYIAKYIRIGQMVRLSGVVSSGTKPYIANPSVQPVEHDHTDQGLFAPEQESSSRVYAIYPESAGITSLWFRHAVEYLLVKSVHTQLTDPIPLTIREQYHLPDISSALVWIHTPEKDSDAQSARKRFAFEEMFVIQVLQALNRTEIRAQHAYTLTLDANVLVSQFIEALPFAPTHAQKNAITEIILDMQRSYPMARLLEGDVGSGKTVVAAAVMYALVHTRPPLRTGGTLQVAYMAPTEILATQHFESFIRLFKHLPIQIGLITGSGCKKFPSKVDQTKATSISRSQFLKWVANGEIAVVVGTHALIQKSVSFEHLALTIVDEQHRFGTRQRHALTQKSDTTLPEPSQKISSKNTVHHKQLSQQVYIPHFLSMTATPIPRTLALTLYGDLELSILDELPAGRKQVITKVLDGTNTHYAYDRIREELSMKRQAYVICPRIEEPDPTKLNSLQVKSAIAEAARLKKEVFPNATVGLLHGGLSSKEKESVLQDFERGLVDILVATSVVEVGINVPNATVILIEDAGRFGLAQLHQLRGRVQRSSHQPYCFLIGSGKKDSPATKRLKELEKSSDGFALAQADLLTRGSGDLYGKRQWGISDIGMEAIQNLKLIQAARTEADRIVQNDAWRKNGALEKRVDCTADALHRE